MIAPTAAVAAIAATSACRSAGNCGTLPVWLQITLLIILVVSGLGIVAWILIEEWRNGR